MNVRFSEDKQRIALNIFIDFTTMLKLPPSYVAYIELPIREAETLAHEILDLLAKEQPLIVMEIES